MPEALVVPETSFPLYVLDQHQSSKTLVADGIASSFEDSLGDGVQIIERNEQSVTEQVAEEAVDYLVVRSATKVRNEAMDQLSPNLIGIGRAGIGVDNIDVEEALGRGILVQNTPEASTESVAEHAFALAMSLLKKLSQNSQQLQHGEFKKNKTEEMVGKNVLIIGAGNIGVSAAAKFNGSGANVRAYDPYAKHDGYLYGTTTEGFSGSFATKKVIDRSRANSMPIVKDPERLKDLIAQADIISLHTPDVPEPIVNEEFLSHVTPGTMILNTGRKTAVDHVALIQAIEENDVAVGLDVLPQEKGTVRDHSEVNALIALQEEGLPVELTSHTAGNSTRAQEWIGEDMAEAAENILRHGKLQTIPADGTSLQTDIPNEARRLIIFNEDEQGMAKALVTALADQGLNSHRAPIVVGRIFRKLELDIQAFDLTNGAPQEVLIKVLAALESLPEDVAGKVKRALVY